MKKVVVAALLGAVTMFGCNGGGDGNGTGSTDKAVSCEPDASPLTVKAKDFEFDTQCLAAKADEAFTMDLVNEDSAPHNLSIYKSEGGESLFTGSNVNGNETVKYEVPALPAGDYYFQCDLHPDMNGKFIVAG